TRDSLEKTVRPGAAKFDFHLPKAPDFFADLLEQGGEIFDGRQRQIQNSDLFLEFRRNLQDRRNDHNGFKTVFELQCDFLQLAYNGVMALREKGMEILE